MHWFAAAPDPGSRLQPEGDGDSMPDDWEMANQLNSLSAQDRTGDFDGDGSSNFDEFLAGTNPNDPLSVFRVQAIRMDSREVRLHFPTAKDRVYVVESCSELNKDQWQQTMVIDGSFQSHDLQLPGRTATHCF